MDSKLVLSEEEQKRRSDIIDSIVKQGWLSFNFTVPEIMVMIDVASYYTRQHSELNKEASPHERNYFAKLAILNDMLDEAFKRIQNDNSSLGIQEQ